MTLKKNYKEKQNGDLDLHLVEHEAAAQARELTLNRTWWRPILNWEWDIRSLIRQTLSLPSTEQIYLPSETTFCGVDSSLGSVTVEIENLEEDINVGYSPYLR